MEKTSTLRRANQILSAGFVLALLGTATPAHATSSVGGMISTLATNITSPFSLLIVGFGFLLGVTLIAGGLMKLAHAGDGQRSTTADGVLRMIGGSLLIGLPPMIVVGVSTFYGAGGSGIQSSAAVTLADPANCMTLTGQSIVLTCVAQNVALNVVPVFMSVLFGLTFLSGAGLIAHALYSIAMSHSTGQRQLPKGLTTRIVIGCLTCNLPTLLESIGTTLGIPGMAVTSAGFVGLNGSSVASMLAYTGTGQSVVLSQYAALIGWLFVILAMFGVIAVWKGLTYLRGYAEGSQQGTMGAGVTHIVGGVLLANGKFTVCIVLNTLLGQGMGFCG